MKNLSEMNILLFIFRYILPYGLFLLVFYRNIKYLEHKWDTADGEKPWKKWPKYAVIIGVIAIAYYIIVYKLHPYLLKQYYYNLVMSYVKGYWMIIMGNPSLQSFLQVFRNFGIWLNDLYHRYKMYYVNSFVVVYFFGTIVEIVALIWRVSFPRAANIIFPTIAVFPRIILYLFGYQTPIQDFILKRKLKAKIRENLNDSYHKAAQDLDEKGEPFKDGAGGTARTQTIKATARAMRRTVIKVKTKAGGIREAHILIRQSRETETDKSIENVLKGLGDRISGNSIFFPSDPTYSPKLKGYTFDSSVAFQADEELGSWKGIFSNPFRSENSPRNNGIGYPLAYLNVVKQIFLYIYHMTPYAVYKRFVRIADIKYVRDTSADNATYVAQQNLDLSVIPTPIDKKSGNDIKTQKAIAMQVAQARTQDVTMALNSVKIYGTFKGVTVGGNTAIYEYVLPQDPNLPDNLDRIQKQISNILRTSSIPIITISAGTLKLSIDNGVNIPVSFVEMIKKRKKGMSGPISGMVGADAMGNPIYFELGDKVPHAMFFGKTGTGKTVSLEVIIYSIMSATDPEHLRIMYIDGKGNSFEYMKADSSHPNPFTYAPPGDASGDIEYARAAIRHLENEVRRRIALFKEREVSKLSDYNKLLEKEGKPILPEILAVIDEFSAITQKDKDLKASEAIKNNTVDRFEYIAKMARSTGIRMLLANQSARKELIPGKISANVPGRVSLGVAEPIESEIAAPESGVSLHLISQQGEFYSFMNGSRNPEHGNSPFLDSDVRFALNDGLIRRFGPCKYIKTREEILEEDKENTPNDGTSSNMGDTGGMSGMMGGVSRYAPVSSKDKIMNRMFNKKNEEKLENGTISVPNPEPTVETSTIELLNLDERYYPYLSKHKEVIEENKSELSGKSPVKRRMLRNAKAELLKKLEAWEKTQKDAKNAKTHRSVGDKVATNPRNIQFTDNISEPMLSKKKVENAIKGNEKDPM